MAANTFNVTAIHDGYRIPLHGDMDVSLNVAVSSNFTIRFFCKTKELFTLKTNKAILDLSGNRVASTQIGGQIGLSYEMMYNTVTNTWEFSDSNVVSTAPRKLVNRLPWETGIVVPPIDLPAAPTIVLTTSSSSVSSNSTVVLTAAVVAAAGIAKVEFFKGSLLMKTVTAAPFTASIPITSSDNGTVSFSTKVYDGVGVVVTSATQSVTVAITEAPPAPADTTPPSILLNVSKTTVTAEETITLSTVATDNVGITKVEFYKGTTLMTTLYQAPFTLNSYLSTSDNGTVPFTAKAFDAAGNNTTSNIAKVTVNIAPPVAVTVLTMSDAIINAANTARDAATLGQKRLAVAQAIVNSLKPSHILNIYRNGTLVCPVTYSGDCTITDDGVNVSVGLGLIATSTTAMNADIATGTWTFTVAGGTGGANKIQGTVGPVGSAANIVLSESPRANQPFDADVSFVIPRALDGFAS